MFLTDFFMKNGYPKFLIEKYIRKFLDDRFNDNHKETVFNDEINFNFVFPYFGRHSEKLRIDLNYIIEKYFPNFKFRIILVNRLTIGSFFRYKDRLPSTVQSSLVYEFSCVQCASRYVGSTHRNLYMRVAEHAGVSFRTKVPLTSPPYSAVREHLEQCNNTPASI